MNGINLHSFTSDVTQTRRPKKAILENNLVSSGTPFIKKWTLENGVVSLVIDAGDNLNFCYQMRDCTAKVDPLSLKGIPLTIRQDKRLLAKYLNDTFVRAVPLSSGEWKIYINQRLRGGILGEVLSTISAGIGFFNTKNYLKLADKVVGGAQSTIKVAGETVNGTIRTAEDAAKKTIVKMGSEVKTSIMQAELCSKQVIKRAGDEIERGIASAGSEARLTTQMIELQIEKAMQAATQETELILNRAGIETRHALAFGGEEARNTWLAITNDTRKNIIEASGTEVNRTFKECSSHVKAILDDATRQSKDLIKLTGSTWTDANRKILNDAFDKVDKTIENTLNQTARLTVTLVEKIAAESKGLIVALGNESRLLIKDTGTEIRATANSVLATAFIGQEMIIHAAGEEMRFTVQEAGKELRSTLYELPLIAGMAAEQAGRNFTHGIVRRVWGIAAVDELVNIMRNLFARPDIDIQSLLRFVYNQTQENISPSDKSKLYQTLIESFNDPAIRESTRYQLLLFVGVAALDDPGLQDVGNFWTTDYAQSLIKSIPSPVREDLEEHGKDALKKYLPVVKSVEEEPLPLIEVNSLQFAREEQVIATQLLQFELDQERLVFFEALEAKQKAEINKKCGDLSIVRGNIENLKKSIFTNEIEIEKLRKHAQSLRDNIKFLKDDYVFAPQ